MDIITYALLKKKIDKIDGTEAKHYSELAEEAAKNAQADAKHIEEETQKIDDLSKQVGINTTNIDTLSKAVEEDSLIDPNPKNIIERKSTGLYAESFQPKYYESTKRVSLRESGDIPTHSFNDNYFIEFTGTNAWLAIFNGAAATNSIIVKNQRQDSLYFIGHLAAQGSQQYFAFVEYNPNGAFVLNQNNLASSWASLEMELKAASRKVAEEIVNNTIKVLILNPLCNNGSWSYLGREYNSKSYMPILYGTDYSKATVTNTLNALNLNTEVPMSDMTSLRIDDIIYKIVDTTAARINTEIEQVKTIVDEEGETIHCADLETAIEHRIDIDMQPAIDFANELATRIEGVKTDLYSGNDIIAIADSVSVLKVDTDILAGDIIEMTLPRTESGVIYAIDMKNGSRMESEVEKFVTPGMRTETVTVRSDWDQITFYRENFSVFKIKVVRNKTKIIVSNTDLIDGVSELAAGTLYVYLGES